MKLPDDQHVFFTYHEQLDRPEGEAPRELRFTIRAMREWRELTGQKGPHLECESAENFAVLIWYMALEADPAVKLGAITPHVGIEHAIRFREAMLRAGAQKQKGHAELAGKPAFFSGRN